MTERLTLYYLPGSYYSQKAALALLEKGVPFNQHYVNLTKGEHLEPWFIRLNRNAQVPLLKDGDKLIPESEDIIKYIDEQFNGVKLTISGNDDYDHINTVLSKNVPIEDITYGTILNPDLSATGLHPLFAHPPQKIKDDFVTYQARIRAYAEEHEELREAYSKHAEYLKNFLQNAVDRGNVEKCITNLQIVFDEVEKQLIKRGSESGKNWLIGPEFTTVDIILTILLNRLVLLGQDGRYFSNQKRTHVHDYWVRVQTRRSFQDLLALVKTYTSQMKKD
ncbi:hypothetical protein SNE40_007567 [Patella caerulea]|uniref:Ganglioside-induced differentiation-associated protein 1 n=1 Tax=Patella caerulea TaxID=87958 RepID=A0AAN8JYS2_PATCE